MDVWTMIFNRLNYNFLLKFILSIIVSIKSAHFKTFRNIPNWGVTLIYLFNRER